MALFKRYGPVYRHVSREKRKRKVFIGIIGLAVIYPVWWVSGSPLLGLLAGPLSLFISIPLIKLLSD